MNEIKLSDEIKEKIPNQILSSICKLSNKVQPQVEIQLFSISCEKYKHKYSLKITHSIPSLYIEYTLLFKEFNSFITPIEILIIVNEGQRIMLTAEEFHFAVNGYN